MQFDTTQNRFLVAGEDGQLKFWDMDNINLLASTDADGGLQVIILWLTAWNLLEYNYTLYNIPYLIIWIYSGPSTLEIQ